jgi:hypothetical protein
MGMDVYGKSPKNETGEYFRRNVWGWRPLWDYCVDNFNDLVGEVSGHYNDGDGLNNAGSLELARRIREQLKTGEAKDYIEKRNSRLASLERPNCELCQGTGIRTDALGVEHKMPIRELSPEMASLTNRTHGWCNGCDGEGKKDAWETSYSLDLDDLEEFAEFLENSGGFEIC